jgi:hypothetical protein
MTQPPAVPTPAALPRPAPGSRAAEFGRIAEDGQAFVKTEQGEVCVGQWAAGTLHEGLAFFARRYDDLATELDLAERRLRDGHMPPEQAEAVASRVRDMLREPTCIGDLAALQRKVDSLVDLTGAAREMRSAERAAARQAAMAQRQGLAEEAEKLATSSAWRVTTERFAAIVDEWKALPRGDRATDQELWKRLSAARSAFDKRRRAHFIERDAQRKEALAAKRALIARAEALTSSTDWAGTTKALKSLVDEWKRAPRGSRVDEDKLWRRFKAAQDTFFAARTAADEAKDAQFDVNVGPKEALVVEAEAIAIADDPKAARRALRDIQRRWDQIGDLPRSSRARLERRLSSVEEAIRRAEQKAWKSANPEGLARAESTVHAFEEALTRLQEDRGKAAQRGDQRAVERFDADIAQMTALMSAAAKAASDFR